MRPIVRLLIAASTDDQTLDACLHSRDPETEVEFQLSLPTIELVRKLSDALLEAADQHRSGRAN